MNSCKYLWSKTKLAYNRQHLVFQKYFHFFLQTRINISIIHSHRYRMNGIIQLQDQEEQEEGEGRKLWRWGCQSRPVQSQARTSKLMLDVDCGMWKQGKVCQRANNTALRKVFCKYIVQGPGLGRGQQGDLVPGQRDLDPRAAGLRGAEPQRAAAVHQPPPPPQPLHLVQDLPA